MPPAPQPPRQSLEPGQLPQQLADMLRGIVGQISKFERQPPHTIQRVAELILRPGRHYKALGPYLHALDRVVRVTSTVANYPLPPAIPDMSRLPRPGGGGGAGGGGGDDDEDDPAEHIAWSNPANSTLGTDEALGGALLTPIPWLTQRSPERGGGNGSGGGSAGETTPSGAQIHSESTETIDGPNGMGSVETVTVSVNGIRSAGHARAITQGELLRQEQRAGVVPVIQLSRSQEAANGNGGGGRGSGGGGGAEEGREGEPGQGTGDKDGDVDIADDSQTYNEEEGEDEEEVPHARGPDEIGVGDTGPQRETTSYPPGAGLDAHDIDVEAAVGRKHEDEAGRVTPPPDEGDPDTKGRASPGAESPGSNSSKRSARDSPEGEPAKKLLKEDGGSSEADVSVAGKETGDATTAQAKEEAGADAADGDEMDTGK